jgi:hypothetical protein
MIFRAAPGSVVAGPRPHNVGRFTAVDTRSAAMPLPSDFLDDGRGERHVADPRAGSRSVMAPVTRSPGATMSARTCRRVRPRDNVSFDRSRAVRAKPERAVRVAAVPSTMIRRR